MVMADRQRPFIGVLIAQGPDAALERDGERLFLLTSTWTRTERSALTQPDCASISHWASRSVLGGAGGGRPRLRLLLLAAGFGEHRHTHVVLSLIHICRC